MSRNLLMYAASEADADLLYATRFFAPDPFLFVQKGRRRYLAMSDLEIDRAWKTASVERVLSWTRVAKQLERAGGRATVAAVIARVLRRLGLRRVEVPRRFPLGLAQELRDMGLRLDVAEDPFWPERAVKSRAEVRSIEEALRAAEAGLVSGIEALRRCRIRGDGYLYRDGRRFTAEDLRAAVNTCIMAQGCRHTRSAPLAIRPSTLTRRATARSAPMRPS